MNLVILSLFSLLRRRIRTLVAIGLIAALCLLCGGLMAFGFAPAQAIQAGRLSRLPVIETAAQVAMAKPGEELLLTGVLQRNPPRPDCADFVVCRVEAWRVTARPEEDRGSSPLNGRWENVAIDTPALTLELKGQPVTLLKARAVRLSGDLHAQIIKGDSSLQAEYEGQQLPDGTRRYLGLSNGDLVTALGKKSAEDGVAPEHIFAGDRSQFEESQREAASGFFAFGLCLMGCAPLLLAGGLLFVVFRR